MGKHRKANIHAVLNPHPQTVPRPHLHRALLPHLRQARLRTATFQPLPAVPHMYLPQEAHKSSTAALSFLGCIIYRPATDAVENGSQIADRNSIICFWENKKGLDSAFPHFVKTTKTKSETLCTFFSEKLRFACA